MRFPTAKEYDGKINLCEHLTSFNIRIKLQRAFNTLKCIIFPCSLKRAILLWFSYFTKRSIKS
ncbi:hypothetical protein MTR_4g050500 [Medicago truncatula]|uniref:Transmembrane protein n=1 Tax=Medicago truncatula TaxID=3880 RepID=G7JET0_MEDTR|nr:hypothetical protein MTR_4g050500 [Medicago truncatula]